LGQYLISKPLQSHAFWVGVIDYLESSNLKAFPMIIMQNMGRCQNVLTPPHVGTTSPILLPTPKNPFWLFKWSQIAKNGTPLHPHKCPKCGCNKKKQEGGWVGNNGQNIFTLLKINWISMWSSLSPWPTPKSTYELLLKNWAQQWH